MADSRNLVLQLLITAKDEATSAFGKVFSYLDDKTKVIATAIRERFADLFGGGLNGAIEFEAQLDKVQAKGSLTEEQLAELRQVAIDLGAKFGISGTEAAQGMESLAAAGLKTKDIIAALPSVLALAKVEAISMDDASAKLVNSLTAVGLGFDQAGRMADVLAKAALESTTSASAVAQALETAGQIARTAGLTFEETAAALTALAKGGIEGEKAGTALQAILTQLLNPASQASQELDRLGITSRDLGTVIGALAGKGAQANQAILAFGETAGPGLRVLISQGQSALQDLNQSMLGAGGTAQQTADTMGTNLKTAMLALQAAWQQVKTALFEPVLEPLAKAAKDTADALNEGLASGAIKPVQEAIKTFVVDAIAAARQFAAEFEFKAAIQSVKDLEVSARESFGSVKDSATTVANLVSVAWNSLASGFRFIGAALLEVAASTVQTLSNIESVASKVGLGSQERANELSQTALGLQEKAKTMLDGINANSEKLKVAFDGLTSSTDKNAAAAEAAAQNQAKLKQELADSATKVDQARTALAAANEEYHNAQARGEALAPVLKTMNERADEYRAALERQRLAQQAVNGQLPEAQKGLENVAAATQATAQKLDALTPPAEAAKKGIQDIGWATEQAGVQQKEYTDGINYLVKGTGDLAKGITSGKDALGTYNKALLDGASATVTAQDKTALLTAEIARVSAASADWRKGKELNIVVLNSLQNTLESTQAKLALLEERQRAGENVDNEIIKTKAEVQAAYNRYTVALDENVKQQERAVAAAQRTADLGQQEEDLNIQRAQSALELARIKGDSNKIQQAENDLIDAQIGKLNQAVASKAQEVEAYDALIAATKRKLEFDGELDISDKAILATMADKKKALELEQQALAENAQSARDNADATREKAKADREAAAAAEEAAKAEKEATAQRQAAGKVVSDTMNQARATVQGLGGDTEALNARFNELQRTTGNIATSMADWMGGTAGAVREVTQEYESQQGRLAALTTTLQHFADTGEYTSAVQQAMVQASDNTIRSFTLLNDQDLGNLRAALDSAKQKLEEMGQATEDARQKLAGMNAELLEAKGEDQKAQLLRQQIDYQERLAEIQRQRQEAELMGNRDLVAILNEQERVLRQINDAKVASIQTDQGAQQSGDRVANSWSRAEVAIRSTGAALGEVHTLGVKVAGLDLSGLSKGLSEAATAANNLSRIL